MKVKERESWIAKNVSKGGRRPSYDQFNKAFKGQERNPKVKEYASQGMKEYHHYSERAEVKYDENDDTKQVEQQKKKTSKTNSLRNIIGRVMVAVASAVVIVSTYATMTIVNSQKWIWNSDHTIVSVKLLRSDGVVLRELPAVVTITQDDPTCNQTGLKTYTATAEDEDEKVYTDVQYETLSPLGHDRHIVEETIENGHIIRVYECSRCHESFSITLDIDEND